MLWNGLYPWLFSSFFSLEIAPIHKILLNCKAALQKLMEVAFPSILVASFIMGIHFILLTPFTRGGMRWMAIPVQNLDYTLTLFFHICNCLFYTWSFVSRFFFNYDIVLIHKMLFSIRATLHELVDMVLPMILLVITMIVSYFLIFAPIQWPLICWTIALILCMIYVVQAQIQNQWYVVVFYVFVYFLMMGFIFIFLYCCSKK